MWLPKIIKTHPNCIPGGVTRKVRFRNWYDIGSSPLQVIYFVMTAFFDIGYIWFRISIDYTLGNFVASVYYAYSTLHVDKSGLSIKRDNNLFIGMSVGRLSPPKFDH